MPRRAARLAAAALALAGTATIAEAATIRVPTDYGTIVAAVAAAADGDKIVVLPGEYAESVTVDGFADLTIKGRPGASITQPVDGPTPLVLTDCLRVRVSGLLVLGGLDAAISVSDSSDVKIDKCDIRAGDGSGIWIWGESARIKVTKCDISDREEHGVFIEDNGPDAPANCLVVACRVSRVRLWGVRADDGTGHRILRCKGFDCYAVGFELNSDDGVMERNLVRRTTVFACYGIRGSNNVCRYNRGFGAGKEGVYVGGADAVVEKNLFRDCTWGIWCPGDGNVIRKNLVDTTDVWGILVYPSGSGNLIEKNTVLSAGGTSLGIYGNDNQYRMNKLKRGGGFGIDLHGGDNEIVSNKIVLSAGTAMVIRATAAGNTIALNVAKKNLGAGLEDMNPGGNTLLDNVFTGL